MPFGLRVRILDVLSTYYRLILSTEHFRRLTEDYRVRGALGSHQGLVGRVVVEATRAPSAGCTVIDTHRRCSGRGTLMPVTPNH